MVNTILAQKGNMEARYDGRGRRVPVTTLVVDPNVVVSARNGKILLGAGKRKKVKKPQNDIVSKVGFLPRFLKEVKSPEEAKIGDLVTVSAFTPQDEVKVTGVTKGHGFAGVVKRWGFAGGPKTHGQSDRHRAPGSIGQTTTPGRVFKGKHMAGHYGHTTYTVTGLEVIEVDQNKNLIFVKGAVPGARNGFVILEKTGKVKSYTLPPEEKPKEEKEAEGTKGIEEKKEDKSDQPKDKEEKTDEKPVEESK